MTLEAVKTTGADALLATRIARLVWGERRVRRCSTLAAFARFVKQRTDPHAQAEIQDLAQQVSTIIKPMFPVSWEALAQ